MTREFKNEWKHLGENQIACNPHPTLGGIIDKHVAGRFSEEWFIIFNDDRFPVVEGIATKAEAFEIFNKAIAV